MLPSPPSHKSSLEPALDRPCTLKAEEEDAQVRDHALSLHLEIGWLLGLVREESAKLLDLAIFRGELLILGCELCLEGRHGLERRYRPGFVVHERIPDGRERDPERLD